jgi:hypothetical protein
MEYQANRAAEFSLLAMGMAAAGTRHNSRGSNWALFCDGACIGRFNTLREARDEKQRQQRLFARHVLIVAVA